jgi:sec-independent protein translocase protein TatB
MFSLGFGEIVIICLILIVVVGPERLPSVMKSVGKTMRTVRQASRDLRETVGLDELMREDVLRPIPPPRRPPPATIARSDEASAASPAQAPAPDAAASASGANVSDANASDANASDANASSASAQSDSAPVAPAAVTDTDPAGERKA